MQTICEAALAALAWQIDLGADEAIAEQPQDRFVQSAPTPKEAPAAPVTRAVPAEPRGRDGSTRAEADARLDHPTLLMDNPTTLAASAQTLDALADAMRTWDGSPLKQGARSFVFSDGLPGADLMVIGEAPGAEEDRQGKPFVGRAGQLLDRMLAAIGRDRRADDPKKAAYIANILPWRPPGNRTPSEAEAQTFLPFVERHIALAAPKVLLTMGNTPTKALLATTTGIKRMRGRWVMHKATDLPVLPSFHPAYLLRQPADKKLAWADLMTVAKALERENPP